MKKGLRRVLCAVCAAALVGAAFAYWGLHPGRPPAALHLPARRAWAGVIQLEEYNGLPWEATDREVQDALAFCNSCVLIPRERNQPMMVGMGATFRQLVLTSGRERYTVSLITGGRPNALVEYARLRDGAYITLWREFYQGDEGLWKQAEQAVRRVEGLKDK